MPDIVYAALDDRLLVARGDDEWTVRECLRGYDVESAGVSPDCPDRAFVGTGESGVLRTIDGGDSWKRVFGPGDHVTALAVSAHDPTVVWAGTEPSAVYRSPNGGDTWDPLAPVTDLPSEPRWSYPPRPETHHVRWIEADPHDPDRLFVAIEAGAFVRTDDGGETWLAHPAGAPRDSHTLATHPDAPGRVYAAAGTGYARSEDWGQTWTPGTAGLDHRYVWGLAVPEADPSTVVVSAAAGPREAHGLDSPESYVYRSTDAGRPTVGDDVTHPTNAGQETAAWTLAMDGLPDPAGTVRSVLTAVGGQRLYALNNRGIYRSENAGMAWQRVPVDWPPAYERRRPQALIVV